MEVAVKVWLGFYLASFLSFDCHVSLKKSLWTSKYLQNRDGIYRLAQ